MRWETVYVVAITTDNKPPEYADRGIADALADAAVEAALSHGCGATEVNVTLREGPYPTDQEG
jgi:hypothetical protein